MDIRVCDISPLCKMLFHKHKYTNVCANARVYVMS